MAPFYDWSGKQKSHFRNPPCRAPDNREGESLKWLQYSARPELGLTLANSHGVCQAPHMRGVFQDTQDMTTGKPPAPHTWTAANA
jgi:hypothetical protein